MDEDDPIFLINEQICGLLEGLGADEDHEDVIRFLRGTGLPDDTVARVHRAIVHGDTKANISDPAVQKRLSTQWGFVPANGPNPAVAAIQYALGHQGDSPLEFLEAWMYGDFPAIRAEWEDVPDEVFVGADPLFKPRDTANETDLWRCTVCGRIGTVGRCCGEDTREPALLIKE